MKISTKGRYALRLMIDLAQHGSGRYISLGDIASRQEISVKYLEQIIGNLCKVGLVRSTRGAQGGYQLTRKPEEYTIGSILRITEGSLAPIACLENEPNQCARKADCATLPFWEGLYRVITDYVDHITLQDLVDGQRDRQIDHYVI